MPELIAQLQSSFGLDSFREGQREVIEALLAGRSAAAVFPTGAGKSLCYQLPALQLPGLTLVVSPLIALMKDQIDQLRARGIPASRLDSSLSLEELRRVQQSVREGTLKLLYVAPERFNNERFRQMVKRQRISLFAIDEAHCISEWGHNFRPDYLKLAAIAHEWEAERVLALTATATPPVLEDIRREFAIAPEDAVRTGFHRPNLTLLATAVPAKARDEALLERLRTRPAGATIVYVTLQRTAFEVAERLRAEGFDALHYHAGMKTEDRERAQEVFLASPAAIVVATIAFGMGIDKADIRYVYHYNLPKSLESYSQEIGRSGRDGRPSTCEILASAADVTTLQNFAHGDTPSRRAVASLVESLFASKGNRLDLSLPRLAREHDLRPLVLKTLLTYLELEGLLKAGTPSYEQYRFRPLATSAEILERFEGERRTFLAGLLKQAKKKKLWFDIDLMEAARALGSPRSRLVRALDYLADQELLEVRAAQVRFHYQILARPEDPEALSATLHRRMIELEAREVARVDQMLEWITASSCQTALLCRHFGEELDGPCGHCGVCEGRTLDPLEDRPPTELDPSLWRQAEEAREANPEALGEPRSLARFLTGLSSPRLSQHRMASHRLFGAFSTTPFSVVLRACREEPPAD